MAIISAGSVGLPDPTSIAIDDEIIWSEDTGRNLSGIFIGDVIAEKKKVSVKWEFLRESEVLAIRNNVVKGFFPVTFYDDGANLTITAYRSTLSKESIGRLMDGIYWYRSVTVDIIQR